MYLCLFSLNPGIIQRKITPKAICHFITLKFAEPYTLNHIKNGLKEASAAQQPSRVQISNYLQAAETFLHI